MVERIIMQVIGTYWAAKELSKEECAGLVVAALSVLSSASGNFAFWDIRHGRKSTLISSTNADRRVIENSLRSNKRDLDGVDIPELGFSLNLSGKNGSSISLACGGYANRFRNHFVLTFAPENDLELAAVKAAVFRLSREIFGAAYGASGDIANFHIDHDLEQIVPSDSFRDVSK